MRVAENLNAALHAVLAADRGVHLLGEDIADPYGGAFKVTRGLSERFPDQVLSTPISEAGITGVASGLALCGDAAIVEVMFGDFVALAFDPLVNFASKSVSMYGSRLPMRMVVRCPSGGGRGYGPTHSQSPMKHFLGVPGLSVYELSPFHDNLDVFGEMLALGEPCLFVEDKVTYTQPMFPDVDPFRWDRTDDGVVRVFLDERPDCVLIAPGGMAHRALEAMRSLLFEADISSILMIPSRLYPFPIEAAAVEATGARFVFVAEESTGGGTWGAEVAHRLHAGLWGRLDRPVTLVHSVDSVIPTASHLEREVLTRAETIHRQVLEVLT
ncbi:transketolase C-terminal domain-containing protein [Catenulispora yoronensis]|uniref:Pyruvate dehydrogenase E1 component subunit beta n=1 Tax=Catenulispora yoronensis TaxID=450799 RepID=A0ABP5F275_9ACTN